MGELHPWLVEHLLGLLQGCPGSWQRGIHAAGLSWSRACLPASTLRPVGEAAEGHVRALLIWGPLLLFPTTLSRYAQARWPCDDPSSFPHRPSAPRQAPVKNVCEWLKEGWPARQQGAQGARVTAASCCPGQVPTLCCFLTQKPVRSHTHPVRTPLSPHLSHRIFPFIPSHTTGTCPHSPMGHTHLSVSLSHRSPHSWGEGPMGTGSPGT